MAIVLELDVATLTRVIICNEKLQTGRFLIGNDVVEAHAKALN